MLLALSNSRSQTIGSSAASISKDIQENESTDAPITWEYSTNTAITPTEVSGISQEIQAQCAIFVPAGAYIGDMIKELSIGLHSEKKTIKNLTVFIKKSLDDTPVYSEDIGDITLQETSEWKTIVLNDPYEIQADEPLYIGYSMKLTTESNTIGCHDSDKKEMSAYIKFGNDTWKDMSSQIAPLCIKAFVYGENIQKRSIMLTGEEVSVCKPGENFNLMVSLFNSGSSAVNLVDLEYTVNGQTQTIKNKAIQLHSFEKTVVPIEIAAMNSEGIYDYSVRVTKIDTKYENDYTASECTGTINVTNDAKKRIMVCEELTGNSCVFCPRGIEGIENMKEKYPDTFLPIAIHQYSIMDPMYEETYKPFGQLVSSMQKGAPFFILNRNTELSGDPYNDLERIYLSETGKYSNINISMYVNKKSENVYDITTDMKFYNDVKNTKYRIALVVIEDSVDKDEDGNPISQANSVWQDQPSIIENYVFEDVARGIFDYNGIEAPFPSSLQKGQTYRYTYELNMPYVLRMENIRIAALIINSNTGLIEDAGIIRYEDFGTTPPNIGTSIKDLNGNAGNKIKVTPTGYGFIINLPDGEKADIKAYTISGTQVYHGTAMSGETNITINQKGVYILRVTQGNHTTDIKVQR